MRWKLATRGAGCVAVLVMAAHLLDPGRGARADAAPVENLPPRLANVRTGARPELPEAQSPAPLPDEPDSSLSNKAPPRPPRPRKFASSPRTQAGQAARRIARLAHSSINHRAMIRFATWIVDPAARWSIRDNVRCLEELRARRIPFQTYDLPLTTPVPTPVEVIAPIDGVRFQMMHEDRTLLMSCEMAARLPVIAAAVKPHGVHTIGVISSYREKPRASSHTMGLALDLWRFFTAGGALSVELDFEITPGRKTCSAPPPAGANARALLDIACTLASSRRFSSVLTPNYNTGHRDHFHVDIRPDDPRLFLK